MKEGNIKLFKAPLEVSPEIAAEMELIGTSSDVVDRVAHEKYTVESSEEEGQIVGKIRIGYLPADLDTGGGVSVEPFWRTLHKIDHKARVFVVVGDALDDHDGSDITRNGLYIGRGESLTGAIEDLMISLEHAGRVAEYELDVAE